MPKKGLLERLGDLLTKAGNVFKKPSRVASGAAIAAIMAGLHKLPAITETFPYPANAFGNIVVFFVVLFLVADVAKGGLYD